MDYHGGFEAYVEAKKKLFKAVLANGKSASYAVLPKDDVVGRKWLDEMSFDHKASFGVTSNANMAAKNIQETNS